MTKELKKWIEDHKEEIKTGAKIAVRLTVAIVIGKKIHGLKTKAVVQPQIKTEVPKAIKQLPKELVEMGFETYSDGEHWLEFANYGVDNAVDLTVEKAHEVIDAIANIDGFTENSRIQAMFNVWNLE